MENFLILRQNQQNQDKSWFFVNMSQMDKALAWLTMKKERRHTLISDGRGVVTTDPVEVERILK